LRILDLEHDLDDVLGDWAEGFQTDCRSNDCDCLNSLTSELLVVFSIELAEVLNQEADSLVEVLGEILTNLFDKGAEGSCRVLLGHGASIFDEKAEFL
jgi:hypothetical protein